MPLGTGDESPVKKFLLHGAFFVRTLNAASQSRDEKAYSERPAAHLNIRKQTTEVCYAKKD